MPSLIQARVSPKLLTQAERMFTGTLYGRIVEVLQNARRAGATVVDISNQPFDHDQDKFLVTIHDDGRGVADFQTLLEMGDSEGWETATQLAEDPAGVGFFSLAPREVAVASGAQQVTIDAAYQDYSWAQRVPRATHVRLVVGPVRHQDFLWSGTLTVVESLRLEVTLSTGQILIASPPLASLDADNCWRLMTPGAEERAPNSDFWLLLSELDLLAIGSL